MSARPRVLMSVRGRTAAGLAALLLASAPSAALAAGGQKESGRSRSASRSASTPAAPTPTAPAILPGSSNNPLAPGVPFSPAPTTATSPPPVVANTSTATSGSSTLSSSGAFLIAGGAVILLVGISYFIWRDARRRAPVRSRAGGGDQLGLDGGRPGSKARAKPRKLSPAERRRRKRGRARR